MLKHISAFWDDLLGSEWINKMSPFEQQWYFPSPFFLSFSEKKEWEKEKGQKVTLCDSLAAWEHPNFELSNW